MQRGLWASQLNDPDAPVQNMALLSRFEGPVDPARLAAAFEQVVRAYDVLRTTIPPFGSIVETDVEPIPSEIVRLEDDEVEAWARSRAQSPLDMSRAGYDSVIVVHGEPGDERVSWYLNLHHVITDATSSAMVFAATAAAYHGESIEPVSYYRWARRLSSPDPADRGRERAAAHWRDRAPAPGLGRLYRPVERPVPTATRLDLDLGSDLLSAVEERLAGDYRMLSADLGWSTLLMTATAIHLHRVSGASSFSIGLPVHNRTDDESRNLIGPTMEVFPVDVEVEPGDTHRSLHKRVGRAIMYTLRNAVVGTAPKADYEAVVNVIPRAEQQTFGPPEYGVPTSTTWLETGAIDAGHLLRVQMTRYVAVGGTEYQFALDVNHGGAGARHRPRVAGHFATLLRALVEEPDLPIGSVPLAGRAELDELGTWEAGEAGSDRAPLVLETLEAALSGNAATAISDGDRSLTGPELWSWIRSTAGWIQGRGVGPGDRVGIELERSIESVVAIMATLVAGGSFVPLDPSQPETRRKRLASRADCRIVLSSVLEIEQRRGDSGPDPVPAPRTGDDEAYLLFTSGSTGEPKGVPITHGGLAGYLRFARESYTGDQRGDHAADRPLVAPLFSALTFDLTITTLFVPLLVGGRLIVVAEDGPRALSTIAANPDITWCKATPSHLELLVRLLPDDHRLSTLIVGGEAFGTRLARDLLAFNPDMAIYNEYGPTEAVVGCMIYRVEPGLLSTQADVPIGRPAPDVTLVVVDEYLQRVPSGAAGELCIAHDGLTTGYLASPDGGDDQSPFVEIDGRRFYRSGDLVRLQDPQRLVYLGRIDAQVKVGGIRLEPTEVSDAIDRHPGIRASVVRLWSPTEVEPAAHCVRCGLPDNIPGIGFDEHGVCGTCHSFDRVAPMAESWFKNTDDLRAKLDGIRARRAAGEIRGEYDCLHLLSGGKDSTYALYRLVELGFRPYVLTLDNGFISEGAKENVRRSVADLGIDHEFATSESMNDIFRDSLDRYSNVCHGCYKTIYTLATNRAAELDIPMIVTGLSRGQLFETRLIPQQFSSDRFDPEAIDRAVIEARKVYHRIDDGPNRMLDNDVFADDGLFERIEYLDFYRYIDVELAEMLDYLGTKAPWVRPADTGRSTNCLINAAGIHTHKTEQGYHNYAVPYAWDVRLGHKTRDEAIEELDDQLDLVEVADMLAQVGYEPRPTRVLTAWIEAAGDTTTLPTPAELRAFLSELLPGHAIPSAFVAIDELPLTDNGKLDESALPHPERVHRSGGTSAMTLQLSPTTEVERVIVEIWERVLQMEPIGTDDDFFELGGDSLGALEMIVAVAEALQADLGEDLAFVHTTVRELAEAIEALSAAHSDSVGAQADSVSAETDDPTIADPTRFATDDGEAPAPTAGEMAIRFDQAARPGDIMYNVGRLYRVEGPVDGEGFERALRTVAARHQPLRWTHTSTRRELDPAEAVEVRRVDAVLPIDELDAAAEEVHRTPFDLENGPLLRCLIQPLDDGTTAVVLAVHHASGDAESFDRLWRQIDDELAGRSPVVLPVDYAGFHRWQQQSDAADRAYWLDQAPDDHHAALAVTAPGGDEGGRDNLDGFLTRRADISAERLRTGSGVARAAVALAAAAVTVRRYSDGPGIDLGLITSARNHEDAADLFGYFLNSVPVRVECDVQAAITELVRDATASVGGAMTHRAYPLARILADRREAGLPVPAGNVLVAVDDLSATSLGGVRTGQRVLSNGTAVADLTFFVEVRESTVDLSLEYRGSTVPAATAATMLGDFERILAAATGGTSTTVGALLAAPTGDESLLVGPRPTNEQPVAERIRHHLSGTDPADGFADRTAVICGARAIDRDELRRRSEAIAAALRARDVQAGDRVLIALPRSPELIAAIVGVHHVGAAYVPVDPGYPASRIDLIVSRSGARVGLVAPEAPEGTRISVPERIVVAPETVDGRPWNDAARIEAPAEVAPGDEAYLIFTSGSTGEPRGVAVSHGQLTASTNARDDFYPDRPRRFLVPSSPAFDSSIVGLFWTLATGGTVVLPTEDEVHDVSALRRLLAEADLTHTLMVPSLYEAILAGVESTAAGETRSGWVDHVIVAGEACPSGLVDRHFELFGDRRLTNEYGPTETTVWSNAHHCSPGEGPVPIGPAIPGAWTAVVDGDGLLRPVGVEGELIIGGLGVTAGYLDDPETTASKFGVVAELRWRDRLRGAVGERSFRTGDRAVVVSTSDGPTVRFLGRVDNQLNVGGARVEPEEIERLLTAEPSIQAAIVVAADLRTLPELLDTLPDDVVAEAMARAAGTERPAAALLTELRRRGRADVRLVAHLEAAGPVDLDSVRDRLARSLPAPVRPSLFPVHQSLPRTPNGKLDREAAAELPVEMEGPAAPGGAASTGDATATRGGLAAVPDADADTVHALTDLFRTTLRDPSLDQWDSFFDRGGHSLLAMELLLAVEDRFGTRLPATALHEASSPAELAARITGRSADEPSGSSRRSFLIPIQPDGDETPVFAIHVLGIDCAFFRPLSERLGTNRPFYGLGQPWADMETDAPSDVSEIAGVYAAEINRVRPEGSIVLAAISLGGVVAFELAHQLRASGRDVALLALFDALGPGVADLPIPRRAKIDFHVEQFRRHGLSHGAERLKFQGLKAQRLGEKAWIGVQNRLNIRSNHHLEIRRFIEDNIAAQTAYHFAPYDGPMLVIKAADDPSNDRWAGIGYGWSDVALNGLEVDTATGRHLSIMESPNVNEVADAFLRAEARFRTGSRTVGAPLPLDRVEHHLISGLRGGRLPAAVSELRNASLVPEARDLLGRTDTVMSGLSAGTTEEADQAVEALERAGLRARLLPVPSRVQHGSATITVEGDVHTAYRVMTELGFDCEELATAAARRAAVSGSGGIDFIRRAATTTRLRLQWHDGPRARGRAGALLEKAAPNRADFQAVSDLPEWAWPAYWAIRPYRVGRDRIPGPDGSTGRDLGLFLGTPQALIPSILALADPRPGELVIDIGSGDGRVLIQAAQQFGCRGVGVERDPNLVDLAVGNVAAAGVENLVDIRHGDGLDAPIEQAGIVFAFLPPEAVNAILPTVIERLDPGGRFISHEQLGVDWVVEPTASRLVVSDPERAAEGGITVANLWTNTATPTRHS